MSIDVTMIMSERLTRVASVGKEVYNMKRSVAPTLIIRLVMHHLTGDDVNFSIVGSADTVRPMRLFTFIPPLSTHLYLFSEYAQR